MQHPITINLNENIKTIYHIYIQDAPMSGTMIAILGTKNRLIINIRFIYKWCNTKNKSTLILLLKPNQDGLIRLKKEIKPKTTPENKVETKPDSVNTSK